MSSFDDKWDSLTGYGPSSSSSSSSLSDQLSCSTVKNETLSDISDISDIKNPLNVSECIRLHSGDIVVKGTIASISNLYKMIKSVTIKCENCCTDQLISYPIPILEISDNLSKCNSCNSRMEIIETEYINAVTIEIQDSDTFSEIEKLSCILFNKNTRDIEVGSKVLITGSIQIIKQKNKKSISRLYSSTIKYEHKEKFELSDQDIQSIRRFKTLKKDSLIDALTKMFAPSIIGLDIIKKGILLSAASSSEELGVNNIRDRIHLLLVGSPGTGKSKLIKEGAKLVPNSRYESSQHASGKSITAIVSKENDGDYCLRIGPVPSARGAICVLNEIGRTNPEDQGFLLDVMEEGEFTINKYGINAKIKSPTVIIASANPIGTTKNSNSNGFDDQERINLDQIPIIKPVIDRFDLVFVVKGSFDKNESRDYAIKKMNLVTEKTPDYYFFLKKYIAYSKRFQPILNEESRILLEEYYVNLVKSSNHNNNNKFISRRCLDTLIRLAKSFAKLKLKNIVEQKDAKEALDFFNAVICQYTEFTVTIPNDPRNNTISVFIDILKNSSLAYSLEELAKEACKRNEYVKSYLSGNKAFNDVFKIGKNRKLRCVYELLLENSHIARIQEKPIVLQWMENKTLSDIYDVYDTSQNKIDESPKKNDEKAIKTMSDMSDMSDSNPAKPENEIKDDSLSSDDKMVKEFLKSEPLIGYKKPFYYCKEHTSVQFIDYNEIIDHLRYSRVHQKST